MIGAGTVISPIIKIVTTVAILAAVYFFIVKPTLDTTEAISTGISESVNDSINDSFGSFSPDVKDDVREAQKLQKQAQRDSAEVADSQLENATKLLNCISEASGDVNEISACNTKFSP